MSGRRQAGGSGGLRGGGGLASGRWSSAVSAQAVYLLCYIFSKTGCGTGTGRRLLKSLGSDNPNAGGRRRLPYEKMLASQRGDSGSVHLSSTAHGISAGICLVLISVSGAEIYNFILVPFASGELVGDLHGAPLRAGHPGGLGGAWGGGGGFHKGGACGGGRMKVGGWFPQGGCVGGGDGGGGGLPSRQTSTCIGCRNPPYASTPQKAMTSLPPSHTHAPSL